jgi:hypothetical protein
VRTLSPQAKGPEADHPCGRGQQLTAEAPARRGVGQDLLTLQRLAGNRAVAGALRAQCKLVVSDADDVHEREADGAADAVMRASDGSPPPHLTRADETTHRVRRICKECEEDLLQRRPEVDGSDVPAVSSVAEARIRGLNGSGQPLSLQDRRFFEGRMGVDFGRVRIHTGAEAAALSDALRARAFTFGTDIALAAGEHDLGAPSGRRLLAHELAHVVQQNGAGAVSERGGGDGRASASLVQRQGTEERATAEPSALEMAGAAAFGGGGGIAGLLWLRLPYAQKVALIDVALEQAAKALQALPSDPALGLMWPLFKAGLEGFVSRLRSPAVKVEEKIAAMDKIAGILAGADSDFNIAYLKGLASGFFLDGMLGIFILIYDLLKLIPNVWGFIKQVGEVVEGFPEEINALITRFGEIYDAIVNDSDSAIEQLKKWADDPKQVFDLLAKAAQGIENIAKEKGGDLAAGMVRAINEPGSAKTLGHAVGSISGMILWEAVFAAITAGGGAALTAAKSGVKAALDVVKKLVGRVVSGFLKIFEEIRAVFVAAVGWVKKAAKAVKGKIASVSERLAKLLEDIGEFFAGLLRRCHESKLICTWPKHHPFPKYLGGLAEQTLKKIPRRLHYRFHSALDKWKGGILGRTTFRGLPFNDLVRELRLFYKTAEGGIFAKYLPDFEQALKETRSVMKGLGP